MEKHDKLLADNEAKIRLYFTEGRTFVMIDPVDNHYKVWNIQRNVTNVTTTYGRIDAKWQKKTKEFPSNYHADHFMDIKIREKLNKGYKELT